MKELPERYNPLEREPEIFKFWEDNSIFKFDPDDKREVFSIDTPPPTISGKMHIGHACSYTQQDIAVRYKRMKGFNIFFPFGTDDNGLATERLIEKTKKVKENSMSREEFRQLCLETLKEIRKEYIQDWKNIGFSSDFSVYYTTINDHCMKISQKSFLDLYKIGREYRMKAPTMWCPKCHMAVAQVELEDKEFDSYFNEIIFRVENQDLRIATTRPELLPACVAVFCHPDDKRYKHMIGKKATVPMFDYNVEIKSDPKVDMEKGTGIMMCCTFGDQDDIEKYKAYNLDLKIAISEEGRMTEIAGKYKGMKIREAREKIIEDLKKNNLLKKQEPIKHTVNVHERCGTEIEILESNQWFIKYLDLKDRFMKAGKELNWYPKHMFNRLENWIKGLQWDWCISRQRSFGVPIPIWYCKGCGEIIPADESQLPVDPKATRPKSKECPKCRSKEFIPEKDVLDTWATSSLTPKLAAYLFKDKPIYKKLYPMSLRPQAHDIITFWLFNTLVKSQLHDKVNPWKDVMISGWVLDPHGKKMSKSKGNVIEPRDVLTKYGADAMRYWAAGNKLGDDIPYQKKDIVTGKKTVTKIFNASKFVIMNLEDYEPAGKIKELEILDRWILEKANSIIQECTESFEVYEYSKAKAAIDNFFWNIFCDYYLEICKSRLYNQEAYGENARKSAQHTLYRTLLNILKLFAPIIPFITEEVYQMYFKEFEKKESVHITSWPEYNKKTDEALLNLGDMVCDVIFKVRKHKSENKLSLKAELKEVKVLASKKNLELIKKAESDLKAVTNAKEIKYNIDEDLKDYVRVKIK